MSLVSSYLIPFFGGGEGGKDKAEGIQSEKV